MADDPYFDWTGGYQLGQWGYQVLSEKARRLKKKNPIGFDYQSKPVPPAVKRIKNSKI